MRPLGAENDKAFALINALDEGQRKQAILNYKVADLVLGPGQDGKTIQPEGIKCSAMNASQQAMLLDLVGEWAGIVNEQAAPARMAEIKANLSETWFAWSGPTTNGDAGVLPDSGTDRGDRVRAPAAWAATRRCTSTRSTAIRRTITARSPWGTEHGDVRRMGAGVCCSR